MSLTGGNDNFKAESPLPRAYNTVQHVNIRTSYLSNFVSTGWIFFS